LSLLCFRFRILIPAPEDDDLESIPEVVVVDAVVAVVAASSLSSLLLLLLLLLLSAVGVTAATTDRVTGRVLYYINNSI
jgi:hypothetical protein